ncbi:hypothetical protein P7C73_g3097, partial [Tremellales sp. Uapishka_1]
MTDSASRRPSPSTLTAYNSSRHPSERSFVFLGQPDASPYLLRQDESPPSPWTLAWLKTTFNPEMDNDKLYHHQAARWGVVIGTNGHDANGVGSSAVDDELSVIEVDGPQGGNEDKQVIDLCASSEEDEVVPPVQLPIPKSRRRIVAAPLTKGKSGRIHPHRPNTPPPTPSSSTASHRKRKRDVFPPSPSPKRNYPPRFEPAEANHLYEDWTKDQERALWLAQLALGESGKWDKKADRVNDDALGIRKTGKVGCSRLETKGSSNLRRPGML